MFYCNRQLNRRYCIFHAQFGVKKKLSLTSGKFCKIRFYPKSHDKFTRGRRNVRNCIDYPFLLFARFRSNCCNNRRLTDARIRIPDADIDLIFEFFSSLTSKFFKNPQFSCESFLLFSVPRRAARCRFRAAFSSALNRCPFRTSDQRRRWSPRRDRPLRRADYS